MKALIIDDEVEIGQLVSRILMKQGLETMTVASLTDAQTALRGDTYDMVFLDLHLPDGVGFSIIPQIRAHNDLTKIVVISAYEGTEEKQSAKFHRVDDYLKKPFSKQQVLDTLKTVA